MHEAKNTARALVRIGYDGSVHKFFRAAKAQERFENELKVLRYLEKRGCDFVPRVLGCNRDELELVTTNCGTRVERISDEKLRELFAELETYGVRHDDACLRNVTYRAKDGRFCLIDFEFATILDESESASSVEPSRPPRPRGEENFRICWSGATDRGPIRPLNEDAFLAVSFNASDMYYLAKNGEAHTAGTDFVFAVSDGMGGERSGEFASRFALDNITRLLPRRLLLSPAHRHTGVEEFLNDLFQGTHRQLTSLGRSYHLGHNMGATLSLVWYVDGWLDFGHIGDSRIYHLPAAGGIRQLSEDHTHVGWLRRRGELNERQARTHPRKNVLSQSLGSGNQFIRPQIGDVRCEAGDRFLLCTDGVIEGIWDRALEDLLREPPSHWASQSPAQRIVNVAIAESGRDNATAVVLELLPE